MTQPKKEYQREEVVKIINTLADRLHKAPTYSLEDTRQELKSLADAVKSMRSEISSISDTPVTHGDIQTATDELDAVVQATEKATGDIMDACEEIQKAVSGIDEAAKTKVIEQVMGIFEACSFQDITGQRITKVIEVVKTIESRLDAILEGASSLEGKDVSQEKKQLSELDDDDLMNGPQLPGQGISQEDIDKLLEDF